jgi:hypothetical protein
MVRPSGSKQPVVLGSPCAGRETAITSRQRDWLEDDHSRSVTIEAGPASVPIPVNSAPDHAANRQVFTLQTGTPTRCKPAPHHAPIRQVVTLQTGTSPRW